jgi:hypothetical protein
VSVQAMLFAPFYYYVLVFHLFSLSSSLLPLSQHDLTFYEMQLYVMMS